MFFLNPPLDCAKKLHLKDIAKFGDLWLSACQFLIHRSKLDVEASLVEDPSPANFSETHLISYGDHIIKLIFGFMDVISCFIAHNDFKASFL